MKEILTMNEDWKENMAYAPLIEEEVDTDYQKMEDFTELELKTEEKEKSMPYGIEDYFGGNETAEDSESREEEDRSELEEDDEDDMMDHGEAYDDYESMPEIPTDIYSGEEY